MTKIKVYNQKGESQKEIKLPARIFEVDLKPELLYQATVAQQANARPILAHAKDRSEKRGGGRKPWRQKGTGRARHGSSRSPIWTGGGATFGPSRDRNFSKSLNSKMRQKALFMALTQKLEGQNIFVLDKLELKDNKTKEFEGILKTIRKKIIKEKAPSKLLFIAGKTSHDFIRVSKNVEKTRFISSNNLNILDVLKHKNIILFEEAIDLIDKKYTKV